MKRKSLKLNTLEWFSLPTFFPPSPAEMKIIGILIKNSIPYIREVSFKGFVNERGNHFRYDFLILKGNFLVEYDGSKWHRSQAQKKVDRVKNNFCKDNSLKLYRLNKLDWNELEAKILAICEKENNIKKD